MKPDRLVGDNTADDVEMERFIDWLTMQGHTPFSMSELQLKEVWLLGLNAFHMAKCQFGNLSPDQYRHHMKLAREAQDRLCSLDKICPSV